MTTVIQPQPGVTVIDEGPQPPPNRCCHYATAILSFLTGGGIFILGIVAIATLPDSVDNWAKNSAIGIWMGAIIAFTGMIGIASTWKYEIKALRGFYIFLGVVTAIFSAIAVIIFMIATLWYAITLNCAVQAAVKKHVINNSIKNTALNSALKADCEKKDLAVALHVVMMMMCGFEFIVAIVGASLACGCCCGGGGRNRTVVVGPQPIPQQQQPYGQQQHYQQQSMAKSEV